MTISENTILHLSPVYKTFSASVSSKDKEGKKHTCYLSVSIPDEKLRARTLERLGDHNANACKISIKKGFLGCFYKDKTEETKPQLVIQDFVIEDYYEKK